MFELSSHDLSGRILGCGDGPASFNAEANERGIRVVSCDPIYMFPGRAIEQRVNECYEDLIAQVTSFSVIDASPGPLYAPGGATRSVHSNAMGCANQVRTL